MPTTISKTIITITVLHRTDEPIVDIDEALERIDTGNGVGDVAIGTAQYVEDVQVPEALVELGNDGTFFDSDLGVDVDGEDVIVVVEDDEESDWDAEPTPHRFDTYDSREALRQHLINGHGFTPATADTLYATGDHHLHTAHALGHRQPDGTADFPQTPEEARTCVHGNRVWFGHECGLCDAEGHYVWADDPHDDDEKIWLVSIPVQVTAESEEQAKQFALDDLRDPSMEWDTFVVQQTSGPHPKVLHGQCRVCGHYGEDCEGEDDPHDDDDGNRLTPEWNPDEDEGILSERATRMARGQIGWEGN